MRPADFGAFIPHQAEPFERSQDRLQSLFAIPLLIGVIDTQNELPTVLASPEPAEQCGPHTANVHVTGGRGSEASANGGHQESRYGVAYDIS